MTTREHSRLLGIFFLIQAGLQIFGGLVAILIYGGLGGAMLANARRDEEQVIGGIFLVASVVIGVLILLFGGLYFFAGWKLLKFKPGARTLGIIASCLSLLGFPLGTALGIYGLWFLFGEAGKNLDAEVSGNMAGFYPPPPNNNWR
jgi:hypothetical protein